MDDIRATLTTRELGIAATLLLYAMAKEQRLPRDIQGDAAEVARRLFTDYTPAEIDRIVGSVYGN